MTSGQSLPQLPLTSTIAPPTDWTQQTYLQLPDGSTYKTQNQQGNLCGWLYDPGNGGLNPETGNPLWMPQCYTGNSLLAIGYDNATNTSGVMQIVGSDLTGADIFPWVLDETFVQSTGVPASAVTTSPDTGATTVAFNSNWTLVLQNGALSIICRGAKVPAGIVLHYAFLTGNTPFTTIASELPYLLQYQNISAGASPIVILGQGAYLAFATLAHLGGELTSTHTQPRSMPSCRKKQWAAVGITLGCCLGVTAVVLLALYAVKRSGRSLRVGRRR